MRLEIVTIWCRSPPASRRTPMSDSLPAPGQWANRFQARKRSARLQMAGRESDVTSRIPRSTRIQTVAAWPEEGERQCGSEIHAL
jgi:hypothetical protein